jgi:hypothetical protein
MLVDVKPDSEMWIGQMETSGSCARVKSSVESVNPNGFEPSRGAVQIQDHGRHVAGITGT